MVFKNYSILYIYNISKNDDSAKDLICKDIPVASSEFVRAASQFY